MCLIPFSVMAHRRQTLQDRKAAEAAAVVPLRSVDAGTRPND
jgi:hypothetical protein